jgi:DNA helicase HerA-like ATPase
MPSDDRPEARATSIDGRRFSYLISPDDLDVATGGYAVLEHPSGTRLAQVTAMELTPAGHARVDGRVLDGPYGPFHEAEVRAAKTADVTAWLERVMPQRARLRIGALGLVPEIELALDAGGFDRHTFLCGQSGSGKTYALGTILERLLLETSLRVVILDPNSDFVKLGALRDDAPDSVRGRYADAAGVAVRCAGDDGEHRLHVRFRDFDAAEQAAVLRLDPIVDRGEYTALVDAVEAAEDAAAISPKKVIAKFLAAPDPALQSLGQRARNLGIDRWQIWSGSDPGSLEDLVQPGGPRCVVADLGSLGGRVEQAVAAEAVLAALWRRRTAREPILIVIDEAHNVCPQTADDPLTAMATEHAVRIAGEGRKFGLVLLVSTQRPQKVHENVVSQCDNLVLMRMNSRSDLAVLSEIFSFVPSPLLALASEFRQGDALLAGKLVPSPTLGRIGPRWSVEGGADIAADWAAARQH